MATNLKWLMMQQSVVVMPTPRVEGWLMEGLLKPYVHHAPLDDPRDVNEVGGGCALTTASSWPLCGTRTRIRMALKFSPFTRLLMSFAENQLWNMSTSPTVNASTGQFDSVM